MAQNVTDESTAVSGNQTGDKEKAAQGKAALNKAMKPIQGKLNLGRTLAVVSGLLSVAPYTALVSIGDVLLKAWQQHTQPDANLVWMYVLVLIGAFMLRGLVYFIALTVTHFADCTLGASIRKSMADALGKAPLSTFNASTSGTIRKSVHDDVETLHSLVAHWPVEGTAAVAAPIALFAYIVVLDWRLALLALATLPIYFGIQMFSVAGMDEKTALMDTKIGIVSSTVVEFASGIAVVKAFGRNGKPLRQYERAADDFLKFYNDWCGPLVRWCSISEAFIAPSVITVINLTGGMLLVQAGYVSAPQVLAATLTAMMLPSTITTIGNMQWSYQLAGSAALRIEQNLQVTPLPEAKHPKHPNGYDVRIDHVDYSYGATQALNDVSLTIAEGTMTALIGPSGSGKSTLATLIARFDDPAKGSISIGGVDVRDITAEELYRTVSFVLQDPQLIRASIRDNIALGRPDATLEQIREAAKAACIDSEIIAFDHGYDTVINGTTALSGGQEQRIAIARALLKDAPILILDEATASVDPESEAQIQQALNTLVAGRTVIVIAHKPSAVAGADQMVVMDHGRISACGTHSELANEAHVKALDDIALRNRITAQSTTQSNATANATATQSADTKAQEVSHHA